MRGTAQNFRQPDNVGDLNELFYNGNDRDLTIELRIGQDDEIAASNLPVVRHVVITIPRGTNKWTATAYLLESEPIPLQIEHARFVGSILSNQEGPVGEMQPFFDVCRALSSTIYIGSFRNPVNMGVNQSYFDIQVGEAFISQWRNFKTGPVNSQNEAAYRVEREIESIFGHSEVQVNPSSDGQTLQFIIDGKSYTLGEQGSGLAQFIIVLANVASQRPSYVLIDEPELSLHPSLQLDFLTTLGSYAKEGTLFATHSIGLARAGAERLYSLVKRDDGSSEVQVYEATPHLSKLLGELSYSTHTDIGVDKVLLVEGATDVKTVQQFLRLYRKEHQVALLPLGGATLINEQREDELAEFKRIVQNVSAVVDSEREGADTQLAPDRLGFVEVCERLKIPCLVLERRAIENYFTEHAIRKVMGTKYRALENYERLHDADPCWAKQDSWRIAREMTLDELNDTDLGPFLNSI